MKELSIKEILDYCIVAGESPLSPKGVIAYKELILSRLEKLEKENAQQKTVITGLQATVEDMKCCDNCRHDQGGVMRMGDKKCQSCNNFSNWTFDELTKEQRRK